MENFIFDLDGTIINSSKEVLKDFALAFDNVNIPVDKSRITTDFIGPPLHDIIRNISEHKLSEDDVQKVVDEFQNIYNYTEVDLSEFYDGMYEFLKELKSLNKRIFMATYKPNLATLRIVKYFKMDMFEDIYTIDKFKEHVTKTFMIKDIVNKYNLNKDETCMIGDAPSDMKAAKEAGVTAVGVLWGYGNEKEMLVNLADKTVTTCDELRKLL